MSKIIPLVVFVSQICKSYAQPDDSPPTFINQSAYTIPFLHLVNDEQYFAKYAVEAHNGFFELMEPIKGKLHIPSGINSIWQDAEDSNLHEKGEYDYSRDFSVRIRFNFYVGGVLVSTAYENIETPPFDASSFTYYFDINPLDFEQGAGGINYAYIEFLKSIKKNGSQLGIEAALSSKNVDQKEFVPIAFGSFYLRYDDVTFEKWTALATDYNIQLKQVADSTMKSIFGELGFSTYFKMTCLQNPCAKGYMYANTMETNHPCSAEPQDSCKEAIVTYSYVKENVPLTIRMSIALNENGVYVYIQNNQYGKKEVSIEQQNILSITELQTIIGRQFEKDSLQVITGENALSFSHARMEQPESYEERKLTREPGYRMIKETRNGMNWKGGYTYLAVSLKQKGLQKVYHFDATNGDLLWITEVYSVAN